MKNVKQKGAVVVRDEGPFKRMCCVFGCPEQGSISNSNAGPASECQWFCRFHFGESADRWPEITRKRRLFADNPPPVKADTRADVTPEYIAKVREELKRFSKTFGHIQDHKAWAKKLKASEQSGEHLSDVQRSAWRESLRESV